MPRTVYGTCYAYSIEPLYPKKKKSRPSRPSRPNINKDGHF
jgi:hypothetical protein